MTHPYLQTHFVLADGRVPFKGCQAQAIVTTQDPRKATCPNCQENLQRLECFLEMLAEWEELNEPTKEPYPMPQQTPAAYATELRALRQVLGWRQQQMADALGLRRDSYSRYERGTRHVPEATMRLARTLQPAASNEEQA